MDSDPSPRLLVLLGRPVRHSLSAPMHNAAMAAAGLSGRYIAVDCGPDDVEAVMRGVARGGGGGNVTVPYKEHAAALLDRPSPRVVATGACNTFWWDGGALHGDNTDVVGLREALRRMGLVGEDRPGHVLILGAGGAARSVVRALEEEGAASISVRNRSEDRGRALASNMRVEFDPGPLDRPVGGDISLVINATSLGLREDDPFPLSPGHLPDGASVMDLVYRPGRTKWIRALRSSGVRAEDGLVMLLEQGVAAFDRWWGVAPDRSVMEAVLRREAGGV